VAYAPHIRKSPLAGIAAKSVIYQFAKGDQIVPNPATTALLRAGDLADRATYYRHDLAFAENPQLPTIPHGFLSRIDLPGFRAIARGAQEQVATFFATNGATVIHPDPERFFEVPISLPLPEDLNYILRPTGPRGAVAPMSGSNALGPTTTNPAGGSLPIEGLLSPVQLAGQPWAPDAASNAPSPQALLSDPQVTSANGLFASPHPEKPRRIASRSKAALPGELASMIQEVVIEEAQLLA
jgi:hypothetical protein